MSLTKILTTQEAAIDVLRPGTGSTSTHRSLAPPALLASFRIVTFRLCDIYDGKELEEALQTLVDRGAGWSKDPDDPYMFEVRIPAEFDPHPYIATLEMATNAIAVVETQKELRTVVIVAPEA